MPAPYSPSAHFLALVSYVCVSVSSSHGCLTRLSLLLSSKPTPQPAEAAAAAAAAAGGENSLPVLSEAEVKQCQAEHAARTNAQTKVRAGF
eukprot:COSAG02_NODE_43301_length_376_cov_0.667870_1_plen_90_part_10